MRRRLRTETAITPGRLLGRSWEPFRVFSRDAARAAGQRPGGCNTGRSSAGEAHILFPDTSHLEIEATNSARPVLVYSQIAHRHVSEDPHAASHLADQPASQGIGIAAAISGDNIMQIIDVL